MPKQSINSVLAVLVLALLAACTPNRPYHTSSSNTQTTNTGTKPAGIQKSNSYDLAFVEFSDRGNIFDRQQIDNILKHIKGYADGRGVTVITYIHGWKHNSAETDSNLKSFRRLLKTAAEKKLSHHRKIIGIYIGWRGLSLKAAGLKNLTYWTRKRVAHDVGRGGITELLLRLESTLYKDKPPTKNILINTGHSMGGAMLLSALNDVLMSRMLDTKKYGKCVKTKSFGHSVLLVNPAVEANEIFQLKEMVKQNNCYVDTQDKILHIISSDADNANKFAFTAGQWLGVSLRRNEVKLKRRYSNKDLIFDEQALDTTTIANFRPFHTGRSRIRADIKDKSICSSNKNREECYVSCSKGDDKCVDPKYRKSHIPVGENEPLSFVYTDKGFMKSHNDIFTPKIAGYLAAIVEEAQNKRLRAAGMSYKTGRDATEKRCLSSEGKFDFKTCFDYFQKAFEGAMKEQK